MAGNLLNKKTALDSVMGGQTMTPRQLKAAEFQFTRTLNRLMRMFQELRETRLRNSADLYSLFMFVWQLERDGAVLANKARNRQAQALLVWLSNGVDQVRPRPRVNLILYHGVLAPRAAWRGEVVQGPGAGEADPAAVAAARADGGEGNVGRPGDRLWADLMQRSFDLDVLACPRCGGRMRLIALIDQASVIQRILRHLGLPTGIPALCPARAPPSLADALHRSWSDASAMSEPCS